MYLQALAIFVPGTIAILTLGFAWLRWLTERKERQAALYVHPFLFAADALQSRIYNVAERCGGGAASSSDFAGDTMYMLASYLGWERVFLRYGTSRVRVDVTRSILEVRRLLSTDRFKRDPRYIFTSHQASIGRLAIARVDGSAAEFEERPIAAFLSDLDEMSGRLASTASLLEDWRASGGVFSERFIRIQRVLVDLVEALECDTNMRLFDSRPSPSMGTHVADSSRRGAGPFLADSRRELSQQRAYCSLTVAGETQRSAA